MLESNNLFHEQIKSLSSKEKQELLSQLREEEFNLKYTEDNIYDITDEDICKYEKQMLLEEYLTKENKNVKYEEFLMSQGIDEDIINGKK